VSWPTCEEGFRKRKLSLFAGQVVNDFKTIPLGPRKVVELTERDDYVELTGLDLASWRYVQLRFYKPETPSEWFYPLGRMWFNYDTDDTHYWVQYLMAAENTLLAERLNMSMGVLIDPNPASWVIHLTFVDGRVRWWMEGGWGSPDSVLILRLQGVYSPRVGNLTTITLWSGSEDRIYPAGTRVEVR